MQNFVAIDKKCPRYLQLKICGPKFTKNFLGMLLHKTPNQPKFCHNWLKNARDVRNQKFVDGIVTKIGPYGGQHAQAVFESDCESNEVR